MPRRCLRHGLSMLLHSLAYATWGKPVVSLCLIARMLVAKVAVTSMQSEHGDAPRRLFVVPPCHLRSNGHQTFEDDRYILMRRNTPSAEE